MALNINKQVETGDKIINNNTSAALSYEAVKSIMGEFESDPTSNTLFRVIVRTFLVGVAAGYRIAQRER